MSLRSLPLILLIALPMWWCPTDVLAQQPPPPPSASVPERLPISGSAPAGSVGTSQTSTPGTSSNTVDAIVDISGAFQGSTPVGIATQSPVMLDLGEAIRRGVAYNLGVIDANAVALDARATQRGALAELLPDVTGTITTAVQKVSLATLGLQTAKGLPPGFQFANTLGPFHYFEAGALVSQRVLDLTAIKNYRSAKELTTAAGHTLRDNRDLVVLAVGGSYLEVVAAAARVDSAMAQVDTARAVFAQATRQHEAGVNAQIDVDRSQVELQRQQLRLISLQSDWATQKLFLGRVIGMPLGQEITLTTPMEYIPQSIMLLQDALTSAFARRADIQAAEAQLRAATQARDAARAQNIPALTLNGGYFVAGEKPTQSNGTFSVFATVDFPIWRGGRIQADIASAEAVYVQRRAEYENVRGQVDTEVRTALLRLAATNEQVAVADSNRKLAQTTLVQARHRFGAGVADTVEVVQAQEAVASAEQDYISSLYAYYLAKLSLARGIGDTEQGISNLVQPPRP